MYVPGGKTEICDSFAVMIPTRLSTKGQCQVRCDDSLGTVSESDDERAKIQLRLHRDVVLMWPSLLMMKPGAGDEAD